jgi:hypothetical protein
VKLEGTPCRMVWERNQETNRVIRTPARTRRTTSPAARKVPVRPEASPPMKMLARVMRRGKRPLQGTKLLVRMASSRSRGESIIRQEITPAALQPKPMHMVRACFPWAPAALKRRSKLKATRGR